MSDQVIEWLLNSDPSIAFQTKRDLLELPKEEWIEDQKNIQLIGWGRQLLDHQDTTGTWGGGLYGPKFISTHYTLLLLRRLEMLPNDLTEKGCSRLIEIKAIGKSTIEDDRIDACITGMGLSILAHFKSHENLFASILEFIENRQLEDGGWNCRHPRIQSNHSSLNTTLSILDGLHVLKENFPKYKTRAEDLEKPGQEFLLTHELYKSHRTKEIIHKNFIDITFPPRWKYNILSALDYFQKTKHPFDERMSDAIEIIKSKEKNGSWPKGTQVAGKVFFNLDTPRQPSDFNTLRALRVLKVYS